MIDRSCAEPVSWLALERHALGELAADRAAAVSAHLAGCETCRAAMRSIEVDRRALPPLSELAIARARRARLARRTRRLAAASTIALAAAALILLVRPRDPDEPGVASIKGGDDLVLGLVRERAGDVAHDPTDFRAGDRFKVLVTCAAPGPILVDVSVEQDGSIDHPLAAASIRCGNRVPLPGAFSLTGAGRASICVEAIGRRRCRDLTPE